MAQTGPWAAAAIMPIFLPKKQTQPSAEAGFSLLEIMVVLAIMGLMLSLVGARMVNSVESNSFIRTSEAAIADVLLVRSDAMLSGESRSFVTHSAAERDIKARDLQSLRRFDVPENWTVEGDIIDISPSGVCSGGYISISNSQGRKAMFKLTPPKCEPVRVSLQDQ